MNTCIYCGEYEGRKLNHEGSIYYTKQRLKHYLEQRDNKRNLKTEEQIQVEIIIGACRETLEEMTNADEFDCINCSKELDTFEELEKHEMDCFKYKREVFIEIPKNEKKTYSSDKATCERCGKVFLHTCKTSLPKHQLNRHQKSCKGTLPYKQRVKDFMTTATDEQLKKLYEFMKTI
jgi:hypothetical protein